MFERILNMPRVKNMDNVSVLNMPLVLHKPGYLIYKDTEYKSGSEYTRTLYILCLLERVVIYFKFAQN